MPFTVPQGESTKSGLDTHCSAWYTEQRQEDASFASIYLHSQRQSALLAILKSGAEELLLNQLVFQVPKEQGCLSAAVGGGDGGRVLADASVDVILDCP